MQALAVSMREAASQKAALCVTNCPTKPKRIGKKSRATSPTWLSRDCETSAEVGRHGMGTADNARRRHGYGG